MSVSHITDETFEKEVLKSTIPVVVDFYADWCGPCKMMAPSFEEVNKEFEGKIKFVKLNVDENTFYAREYGIVSIPCMIVFKNGNEASRQVGAMTKVALKEWIHGLVK